MKALIRMRRAKYDLADTFRHKSLLRLGFETWSQGLAVMRIEEEIQMAKKLRQADEHHRKVFLR